MQREGFTLGAIKHLLESAGSYSAIVAERRRGMRAGAEAIRSEVPLGHGLDTLREIDPRLPERMLALGLLRRDGEEWLIPTPVAGITQALVDRGVPDSGIAEVGLDVAEYAQTVAIRLTGQLSIDAASQPALALVAVQLVSALFEAALDHAVAGAVRRPTAPGADPVRRQASR
jgi:hypothetical protein